MASRNRGKATRARDNARHYMPTDDEGYELLNSAMKGSPTAAAILGASFVEFALDAAIRELLLADDDTWEDLVGDNGPLSTFYQKALIGYSLGIFEKDVLGNLKIIKFIRNSFAHPRKNLDFSTAFITDAMKKVVVPSSPSPERKSQLQDLLQIGEAKETFIHLCIDTVSCISWSVHEILKRKTAELCVVLKSYEQDPSAEK